MRRRVGPRSRVWIWLGAGLFVCRSLERLQGALRRGLGLLMRVDADTLHGGIGMRRWYPLLPSSHGRGKMVMRHLPPPGGAPKEGAAEMGVPSIGKLSQAVTQIWHFARFVNLKIVAGDQAHIGEAAAEFPGYLQARTDQLPHAFGVQLPQRLGAGLHQS